MRSISAVALATLLLAGAAANSAWAAPEAVPASMPAASTVSGAGASFPAPVYAAWASNYQAAKGLTVNYTAVGSGAGIKQIEAAAVDFGGTDKPLTRADLDANKLIQFPMVLGGVVPVINVPGISSGQLRLDGPLLADIFAGKVKMWNDPRIAALNPGLSLPDLPVSLAVRSDASGTTFLLTSYLSAVSPQWKSGPGAGDQVNWVWGIAGKGNAGVASIMADTMGTIGYVEYAYAKQNNLDLVVLKNHDGDFVSPDASAFSAAADGARWSAANGFYTLLLDQPGAKSWPISGATYLLVRKDAPADKRSAVLGFVGWAYANGDGDATKLNYVPLPSPLKAMVRASWGEDAPR